MNLSKSKIMAFRQCPKRLWLEVNKPELMQVSMATQAKFNSGNKVGEIARSIYDPNQIGIMIDIKTEGFSQALARSQTLTKAEVPVFEAGFSCEGLLAFADVMLPKHINGQCAWKMVEVKSSTEVKDYHYDDIAVQSYVAQLAGFPLKTVSLAHIDSSWVYPGDGDYSGLLVEKDLTDAALSRSSEVRDWVNTAHQTLKGEEPKIEVGEQCFTPFDCSFYEYCVSDIQKAECPISWLPRLGKTKAKQLDEMGIIDLRDVPDEMLNDTQRLVKKHTVENTTFFDIAATKKILGSQPLPAYFLDFETINVELHSELTHLEV